MHKHTNFVLLPFLVIGLCAAVTLLAQTSSREQRKALQTQQTATVKNGNLVDAKSPTSESREVIFDFGTLRQLDTKQKAEDLEKQINFESVLPGIKHIFTLKNTGKSALTISDVKGDSFCIQAEILKNGDIKNVPFPYIVQPGQTVDVRVAFNHYTASPGFNQASVALFQPLSQEPIAVLVMRGEVRGGVRFVEKVIDFGGATPAERSQRCTLVLDPRVPRKTMVGPLKLISLNPHVSIENLDKPGDLMGMKLQNNEMTFPIAKPFPRELPLHFKVTLSDFAPLGKVNGKIALIMMGAPYAVLARDVFLPLKGEIKGCLRAPLVNLVLEPSEEGILHQSTVIYCTSPVKVDDLKIKVNSPLFQPKLRLPLASDKDVNLAGGEKAMILDVTASKDIGYGRHNGEITISNRKNAQYLEIPVSTTVQKIPLKSRRRGTSRH